MVSQMIDIKSLVPAICCGIMISTASQPANAISVELAKKCRDLAVKAHPYELPGEKAGSAAAERNYFSQCVSRNGNMPADTSGAQPDSNGSPSNSGPSTSH